MNISVRDYCKKTTKILYQGEVAPVIICINLSKVRGNGGILFDFA